MPKGEYKPKTFVSRAASLYLVDPADRPHHDKVTHEAVYGTSFQFRMNVYTTQNAREEKVLLNHPAYGTEFWLEGDQIPAQRDQVVDTVTVPTSPNVGTSPNLGTS